MAIIRNCTGRRCQGTRGVAGYSKLVKFFVIKGSMFAQVLIALSGGSFAVFHGTLSSLLFHHPVAWTV